MGTLNSIYVRASDRVTAAALRASYPAAYSESGSLFWAIDQPDNHFRCPGEELQALSARLKTDVIWLSFQSAADAFQYHHWIDGKHIRSLVYGCFQNEREWERVEGTPQPWEANVFFSDLNRALKHRDTDEERRDVERIYRGNFIEVGAFDPSLDARESARGVAKFLRLPGWSLAEEDAPEATPVIFEFRAELVIPDRAQQSLSFADRLRDHNHYLIIQRDEENAEGILSDVDNVYVERDDQQFGGYGGFESVTLERDRLTLKLTPRMAKQMGHCQALSVTFAADDSLFAEVKDLIKLVFRGYDTLVHFPM